MKGKWETGGAELFRQMLTEMRWKKKAGNTCFYLADAAI